jgi:membrane protease YdiL (CAAX protease family)
MFSILAFMLGCVVILLAALDVIPSEMAITSALSASVAGVIMIAIEDGRPGLKLLMRRLTIWRVGLWYWVLAVFLLAVIAILGLLLNPIFGGEAFSLNRLQPAFPFIPMFLVFFLLAGLGQELGWTGYLLPRLQVRYNAFVASLIRALIVLIWHFPLLIYSMIDPTAFPQFPYGGWIVEYGFAPALLAMFSLFILPWSILFTWMFNSTKGSILLVSVLHGSELWVGYWMMRAGFEQAALSSYWGYGALLVVAAGIITFAAGWKNLDRSGRKVIYQEN